MPDLIKEWQEKLNNYEADIELIDTELNASFNTWQIDRLRLFRSYLGALKRTVDELSELY